MNYFSDYISLYQQRQALKQWLNLNKRYASPEEFQKMKAKERELAEKLTKLCNNI